MSERGVPVPFIVEDPRRYPTQRCTVSELAARIAGAVSAITLVVTHEHLLSEAERSRAALDFSFHFPHYAASDLLSAGMPPALLEAIRLRLRAVLVERAARMRRPRPYPTLARTDLAPEERGEALEPDWSCIRHTGYGQCLRMAARELFGVSEITRETSRHLSAASAASNRPGWYQHVLTEKARIAISLQDAGRTGVGPTFFAPVVRRERFAPARTRDEVTALEAESGSPSTPWTTCCGRCTGGSRATWPRAPSGSRSPWRTAASSTS